MKRKYGWRGYIRDQRDDAFKLASPSITSLPEEWSLLPNCTRLEDQTITSSCTGYGGHYPYEAYTRRIGADFVELSPYFLYYVCRLMDGIEDVDGGGYIPSLLNAMMKYGCCQLEYWPSDPARINERPTEAAFADAATRRIKSFHKCDSIAAVCSAISQNMPIVWGIACYESYDSIEVMKSGVIPFPQYWEKLRGGHCLANFWYNRREEWFRGPNSYGISWGNAGGNPGWWQIPFRYFEENLANSAYAIVL